MAAASHVSSTLCLAASLLVATNPPGLEGKFQIVSLDITYCFTGALHLIWGKMLTMKLDLKGSQICSHYAVTGRAH